MEELSNFLHIVIVMRTTPLEYMTRETETVVATPPELKTNGPNSNKHGSVEDELVTRTIQDHFPFQI